MMEYIAALWDIYGWRLVLIALMGLLALALFSAGLFQTSWRKALLCVGVALVPVWLTSGVSTEFVPRDSGVVVIRNRAPFWEVAIWFGGFYIVCYCAGLAARLLFDQIRALLRR